MKIEEERKGTNKIYALNLKFLGQNKLGVFIEIHQHYLYINCQNLNSAQYKTRL